MPDQFTLVTEQLGGLPIINTFIDRLGLDRLLAQFVAHDDARTKLAPAAATGVVVRNLLVDRRPVYALGEWAEAFDPTLLGLSADEVGLLNDDRVGRALSRLFDADRATLLTRTVLDAIDIFDIDTDQLHNDSTTVTFAGTYAGADGHVRGDKATPKVTHGHNKDHRPDLPQVVIGMPAAPTKPAPCCVKPSPSRPISTSPMAACTSPSTRCRPHAVPARSPASAKC